MENKNFFITPSSILPQEFFEKLIEEESFFVEKIISEGHATPEGEWYDQDTTEFVMLLKGRAILEFEEGEKKEMVPGDYVTIPKNKKHRVSWTDPRQKTFWLAIHYK
ncbi:MAG: cupin [Ignavibacteriae bacterium HGW-Ignavibacteriae-2]|jgi:cupin 2 domain-containing protein|nr:cupin domain-containing protein [Bacteroidota bacterium]PKL88898.1 MAG: cupin [Ignavibacteriae bacterium HGW-Ignavibacteriae-2]